MITLFMGISKKVYILIGACVLALVAAGLGLRLYQNYEEDKAQAHNAQLVEAALEQALQDIEAGHIKKTQFDEETQLALEQSDISFLFHEAELREAVANKLCAYYETDDLDGFLEFLSFLSANHINMLSEGTVYDICFSQSYLAGLKECVTAGGEHTKTDGATEIYTYKDTEFWFTTFGCYVQFEYTINGEQKSDTEILGTPGYRKDQHKQYDESSPGYYLVSDTATLTEDKIENSQEQANKYYPAATCPECGIRFRENTMRARMIAKYGYCGMGLCEKD